jgi:serine protease
MNSLRTSTLAIAILATLATSVASSIAHAGGIVPANPYSPARNHPYRHGVIPTLNVQAAMRRWQQAHPLATNSRMLSFGGGTGGVGVTSGPNKVYLVFYGLQWGTASTDANGNLKFSLDRYGAAGAAQQMFKGIGTNGETWQADLTQWCDGAGISAGATACPSTGVNFVPYQTNVLAGVWYDNALPESPAATPGQLANEAVAAAAHFGNTTAASNRYAYYVILSPSGTNPDLYLGQYCAWHDYTSDAGVTSPYGEIAFSNQPYNIDSNSLCGTNFVNSGSAGMLDGYTMTLGHEWHETLSDQFPAGGWTNHDTGTYAGQENSDECAWLAPGTPGGAANVAFATGSFAEQASWSNDTNQCSMTHAILH